MPVIHPADAVVHDLHGSRFTSFAAPARGSSQLCAWRLDVPPGLEGAAHRVSHEEVLLVLEGALRVAVGDEPPQDVAAGAAVVVPPGALFRIDNPGAVPAAAWVTTSVGLEAVLADGSRLAPPWTR